MPDLDELLRESLRRDASATPGASHDVVAAVRERLEAGDRGLSAGAAGPWARPARTLLGWAGAGALAVVVGGTVGLVGLPDSGSAARPQVPAVVRTSHGLDCPNGSPVVAFGPGDRVLAVLRSPDDSHLGVRSPFDRDDVVWVRSDGVELDDTDAARTLPVEDCVDGEVSALPADDDEKPAAQPTATATTPPTAGDDPAPDPDPKPQSKPNAAPRITSAKVSGDPFCGSDPAFVEAMATDDHAVTEVVIRWTGADTGGWVAMTRTGGTWRYTYHPPSTAFGDVTFTIRASDAQGLSHTRSVTTNVDCLI